MGIIRPEGRFVRDNGNVIILSIFLFEGRNPLILLAPLEELLMKVKFIESRGLCEGHVVSQIETLFFRKDIEV